MMIGFINQLFGEMHVLHYQNNINLLQSLIRDSGVHVGAAAAASSSVIMVAAGPPGVGHLPRGQ